MYFNPPINKNKILEYVCLQHQATVYVTAQPATHQFSMASSTHSVELLPRSNAYCGSLGVGAPAPEGAAESDAAWAVVMLAPIGMDVLATLLLCEALYLVRRLMKGETLAATRVGDKVSASCCIGEDCSMAARRRAFLLADVPLLKEADPAPVRADSAVDDAEPVDFDTDAEPKFFPVCCPASPDAVGTKAANGDNRARLVEEGDAIASAAN